MVARHLPSNPKSLIPIFPLATVTLPDIDAAIEEAPEYGGSDFRDLVRNTIGAIHQIPRLFHRKTGIEYQLKQLEAYFGRSSCGSQFIASNLGQRLRAGREQREHDYGMIFAKTPIQASLRYERHGIRLLQVLHDMDGLCISNNSFAAVGRVGSVEPGFLYMTFRMLDDEPEAARELTKEEIRELVREYRAEIGAKSKDNEAAVDGFEIGLRTANDVRSYGDHRAKLIDYSKEEDDGDEEEDDDNDEEDEDDERLPVGYKSGAAIVTALRQSMPQSLRCDTDAKGALVFKGGDGLHRMRVRAYRKHCTVRVRCSRGWGLKNCVHTENASSSHWWLDAIRVDDVESLSEAIGLYKTEWGNG